MTKSNDSKLERLDPESEECFAMLVDRISEELAARIAIGDDISSAKGQRDISELIADAILDVFIVRQRATPRFRWVKDD